MEALALFQASTQDLITLYANLPKKTLVADKVTAQQVLAVLASRKNDQKAKEFVARKFSRTTSRKMRLKFNMDNTKEETIASFSCLQQTPVFSFVQLFITTTCVCWSASLSNYRVVVPLVHVFNIAMEDDVSLTFVSDEPLQSYLFRSFTKKEKLEQAYKTLVSQAKKAGNTKCTEAIDTSQFVKRMIGRSGGMDFPEKAKLAQKTTSQRFTALLMNNMNHPALVKQKKELKYRAFYGLPEDEPIMQTYVCNFNVALIGKMTIAQHFLCFRSKFPQSKIVIPFSDIRAVEKKRTTLLSNNSIAIKTASKSYIFSSFQNQDEVFQILNDLWDAVRSGSSPKK